jgi:predicted dehydrogenase
MNRRTFLTSMTAAGALTAAPRLFSAGSSAAPIRVGVIGCGWYGLRNLGTLTRATAVEVISLCDPNQLSLRDGLAQVAKSQSNVPRTFADFREMLRSAHHDLVIVATPDHWHPLPAITAMQSGADLWLEKPIGIDVIEGEALVAAARKYNRVVQVNTQRRSTPHLIEARDKYVRAGRLGPIGQVETYSYFQGRLTEIVPDSEPPSHLNYDLWTGPAPMSPFKAPKEYKGWRNWRAYGSGQIGDVGVHMLDAVRWMLGLGWPLSISSTGGIFVERESSADITDTQRATFVYPNLELTWEHRTWGPPPWPEHHWTDLWGMRLIGTKGILRANLVGYEFTPVDGEPEGFNFLSKTHDLKNIDYGSVPDVTADAEMHHCLDLLHALQTRERPVADVEEGHISTAMCQLANTALQLGRALSYDPKTRTVKNDPEATKLLERPYRGPWVHPRPETV